MFLCLWQHSVHPEVPICYISQRTENKGFPSPPAPLRIMWWPPSIYLHVAKCKNWALSSLRSRWYCSTVRCEASIVDVYELIGLTAVPFCISNECEPFFNKDYYKCLVLYLPSVNTSSNKTLPFSSSIQYNYKKRRRKCHARKEITYYVIGCLRKIGGVYEQILKFI